MFNLQMLRTSTGSCPKIHKFKKPTLEMNKDMHSRHELSAALSQCGRYQSEYWLTDNVREVSATTPKHTWGIVIHRQFFVSRISPTKCALSVPFLTVLGTLTKRFKSISSLWNASPLILLVRSPMWLFASWRTLVLMNMSPLGFL